MITNHSAIMDHYDPDKKVELIVDEWGTWYAVEPGTNPGFLYQQNSLRDALVASLNFDIFNRHCERVTMTNIAQTVNVLQALLLTEEGGDRLILTPTYHVFEMYKVHHDATLLPLDLRCDDYSVEGTTMPGLSATASRNASGEVHLSLTNVNPTQDATVRCEVRGLTVGSVSGRVLTADAMNAHNTFDAPETVKPVPFHGATLENGFLTIQLPAKSVVSLALLA